MSAPCVIVVLALHRRQYEEFFIREVYPDDRRQFCVITEVHDLNRLDGIRIVGVVRLRGYYENPAMRQIEAFVNRGVQS